jgi:hypothetical protein
MAIVKPDKPDVELPTSFGGVHTAYTQSQIDNGYQDGVPQVVDGGNINYEKDGVFKTLDYTRKIADYVRDIPLGKTIGVDDNNRLDYVTLSADADGKSITKNASNQLQAVGVIDTGTTTARKFWSGTQKEYNEQIKVPDANTQYDITDDFTAAVYEAYSKSETNSLLDNKADTELSNLADGVKASVAIWGMPDYDSGIEIWTTLTATKSSYTAPSNGYFACHFYASASNGTWVILPDGSKLSQGAAGSDHTSWIFPLSKGETISMYADTRTVSGSARFYPLKGETNA